MKKQGAMPTPQVRQCDYVSEGVKSYLSLPLMREVDFAKQKTEGENKQTFAKSSLLQSFGQLPHQRKPKNQNRCEINPHRLYIILLLFSRAR